MEKRKGWITISELMEKYEISKQTALRWKKRGCPCVTDYKGLRKLTYFQPEMVETWRKKIIAQNAFVRGENITQINKNRARKHRDPLFVDYPLLKKKAKETKTVVEILKEAEKDGTE